MNDIAKLRKSLDGLTGQLNDKLFLKINKKGAEPLVHRMHRLAPVGETGHLAESIGTVSAKSEGLGAIETGPRRRGGYKGFAGHLMEFGTKIRQTKGGANRGKVTARPFVRPAWEDTNKQVLGIIEKNLSNEVEKYLNRTVPK